MWRTLLLTFLFVLTISSVRLAAAGCCAWFCAGGGPCTGCDRGRCDGCGCLCEPLQFYDKDNNCYRDTNATLCNNHAAAIYENVGLVNGERYRCSCLPQYAGQYCDRCPDVQGHDKYPNCCPEGTAMWPNCSAYCTQSTCNNLASNVFGTMRNCTCTCLYGYAGKFCERCDDNYDGYPYCTPRFCSVDKSCSSHASVVEGNIVSGCICTCLPGYRGATCNECDEHYEGYPNCTAMKCNASHVTCRNKRLTAAGLLKDGCFCTCNEPPRTDLKPPCWSPTASWSLTVSVSEVSSSKWHTYTSTAQHTSSLQVSESRHLPTRTESVTAEASASRSPFTARPIPTGTVVSHTLYVSHRFPRLMSAAAALAAVVAVSLSVPAASVSSVAGSAGSMQRTAVQSRLSIGCGAPAEGSNNERDDGGLASKSEMDWLKDPLDLASSPTQLGFGDERLHFYRGAVIGNLFLILLGGFLCLLLLVVLRAFLCRSTEANKSASKRRKRPSLWTMFLEESANLRVPSLLYIPASFLLPSITSSCITLAVLGDTWDLLLALFGMLLCISFISSVWYLTTKGFHATFEMDAEAYVAGEKSIVLQLFAARGVDWVSQTDAPLFVALYGGLFEGYIGRPWFCVLDLVLGLIAGILGGVLPMADYFSLSCPAIFAIQLVSNAAYLQTVIMLRPHMVLVEAVLAWINAILGVVWGIAEVVAGSMDAQSEVGSIVATIQMWIGFVGVAMFLIALIASSDLRSRLYERLLQKGRPRRKTGAEPEGEEEGVDLVVEEHNEFSSTSIQPPILESVGSDPKDATNHRDTTLEQLVAAEEEVDVDCATLLHGEEKPPQELVKDFEVLQQLRGGRPIPRATLSVLVLSATLKRLSQLESAVRRGELQAGSRGALDEVLQCISDVQTCKLTTSSSSLI